jgi:hypothetical protein
MGRGCVAIVSGQRCVGPTIPDSRDVLPAMLMIKPALLSYRDEMKARWMC